MTIWASRPWSTLRLATRARIVLACAEGLEIKAVAARLRVCSAAVGTWRRRFLERRLEGLADEPRPGAPRKIIDADVERVVTRTLETKPEDATHRSTRGMAQAAGMSHSAVGRLGRPFRLKPHLAEIFKLSADPSFREEGPRRRRALPHPAGSGGGDRQVPPEASGEGILEVPGRDPRPSPARKGLGVRLVLDNYATVAVHGPGHLA